MLALHLADAAHAGGQPVWFYELAWSFNADEGASHGLDFLLIFGTLSPDTVHAHPSAHRNAADEIIQVAHQMRSDWVSFATTGAPGWAPYDPHTRITRVYNAETTTEPYPEEDSRSVWAAHQFDILDLPTRTAQGGSGMAGSAWKTAELGCLEWDRDQNTNRCTSSLTYATAG